MKLTRFTNLLIFATALVLAMGCKKTPVGVTTIPGSRAGGPEDPNSGKPYSGEAGVDNKGSGSTGIPQANPSDFANFVPDREKFSSDTVHFAFDSSTVTESDKSRVAHVADYLRANPADAVRIEGYCDERGTEGYNMTLGERRATAVREEMAKMGANPGHILTISFGEENPVDPGHTEAAFAKNRRAVFVLLTPPK